MTFGQWERYKLGHGDQLNQLVPRTIDAIRGERVVEVAAGPCRTTVLKESGEVVSWGW